jgi:FAD/FMN-containing dehydrogenase
MIDRKPALIARCKTVSDVVSAVNFAREHDLLTAIRGAGHNIAGNAVCENGLMIDLSGMNGVTVDPEAGIAHVEPGATLGDLDRATQEFGMAVPVGINSTTGVAGLTLGGGFGWLTRLYGMTVDSLVGADVVTADGQLLHTSEKENSDLFWATRGGGGNFGVVVNFDFKAYPLGPDVYSGLVVYSLDEAESVLRQYREHVSNLSNETSVWVVLRKAPPLPFLPESVHGKEIVALACFHAGDPKDGEKAIEPFRKFGNVLGEHLGAQPFCDWQTAFDPLLTPGNFETLEEGFLDQAIKYASELPSDECEIFIGQLGGQVAKKAVSDTAYPHRDANFVLNVHGRWQKEPDDEKCIAWARKFYQDTIPFATGGVYVNFLTKDETDRVKAAYGENYDRLLETKRKYDPNNLFRMNWNIPPEK